MNSNNVSAPTNDTTLKAERKTYHNRQLFHLYAVFITGLWEVATTQNRTITFSWDSTGKEQFPIVQ